MLTLMSLFLIPFCGILYIGVKTNLYI